MMAHSVMIGNWMFDFNHWWLVAMTVLLVLALPFTLVACWQRLFPAKPFRAALVGALNILAFTALFLLLTEPRREHMTSQSIILISEGANLKDNPVSAGEHVYIAPDALPDASDQQAMANANWLLDMGQLTLREPALTHIELHGYGLNETQWQAIPEPVTINFTAPPLMGFSHMSWPQTLIMGGTLAIQGSFSGPQPDGIIELRLLDPAGQQVAQERIRSGKHFNLKARPKSQGNVLYQLQAWQSDTLLSDQPVTVSVSTGSPLRIMVQQSAPSFETRQLKDFAADIGSEVLVNTTTSQGKSITQVVNPANTVDSKFSPVSLAASDWLIIDGRALTDLPPTQQAWLSDAVQLGLGVLVLADESLLEDFDKLSGNILRGFALSADPGIDAEAIPEIANVTGLQSELTLPVAAMRLTASSDQSPLSVVVTDQNGRTLVASQDAGLGKIAIGLVSQSYRWVTAGHRTHWSNYWSALSTALSRSQQDAVLIAPGDSEFYDANQRVQICAFASQQGVSVRITADAGSSNDKAGKEVFNLPLTADRLGSARKCGWFWPASTGWQSIQLLSPDGSQVLDRQSRYIWNSKQWPGQRRFERINATAERLAQTSGTTDATGTTKTLSLPLSVFWLWLFFITCASGLWLERKLHWDAP